MFEKMKLSSQLNISFFALLGLLTIIALSAYSGLSGGYQNFTQYRELARDTNLAGRVQANLLMVRLNVVKYFADNSPEALQGYEQRLALTESFLATATKEIQNPERAKNVSDSIALLQTYKSEFNQVIRLVEQRHKQVETELDPAGLAMRTTLTKFMDHAKNKGYQDEMYLLAKAQESLLLGRLYVTKFLVTNENKDYDRAISELESNLPSYMSKLSLLLRNEQEKTLFSQYNRHKQAYLKALKSLFQIITSRNHIINNNLNVIGPQIADKLESVKLSVKQEQDILGPRAQADAKFNSDLVSIISIISIVLGLILAWYLAKTIRKPIGGEPKFIADMIENISKGDLTTQFDQQGQATGIYSSAMHMTTSLRQVIRGMIETSRAVSSSANSVADSAAIASVASKQQSDKTQAIVLSINEVTASIHQVAKLASDSATATNNAKANSQFGQATVSETINSIQSLANRIENAVEVIESLAKNTANIDSVIEVIEAISEQTNLLALNAAIEAARAGEQGKGFAVVAEEVRNLAMRTKDSTSEIQAMIHDLQSKAAAAVEVMNASKQETSQTVDNAEQTAETLDKVLAQVIQINDMNVKVATSVEEQASAAEKISDNISEISTSANKTKQEAENTSASATDLISYSQNLDKLIGQFRL